MSSSLIWCLGLYGSASTWTFNVVRLLHHAAGVPVRGQFAFENMAPDILAKPGNQIVKSHEIEDGPALSYLQDQARLILITIRDPRDAVTSLIRSHESDFADALTYVEKVLQLCARMATRPNAHLLRYETRFFEDPATIPALAELLGYEVSAIAMKGIFNRLTRAEVEKYIATLPGKLGILVNPTKSDYLDAETHWHTHHAGRKGEVGGYRGWLQEDQIKDIEERLSYLYSFERLTLVTA